MFVRVNHLRHNTFYDIAVEDELASALRAGDFVILHFPKDQKTDTGKVVFKHDFETLEHGNPQMVRAANDADLKKIHAIREEERAAFTYFVEKAQTLGLPMQPVAVFFSFDGEFGDFVFTAEDRVDFRDLVRDLTSKYKRRIFLEQVSPRERASIANGCGSCGRTLCCSTFLKDRPPVVMQAVRAQNMLFRDRDKLTGLCGKLKCCLNYELDVYEELSKAFPPMHSEVTIISTNQKGTIIGRSILDQQVRVLLAPDGPVQTVRLADVQVTSASRERRQGSAVQEAISAS